MYNTNHKRPLVVDIKRGSLEDGPGIRSVVFFKGCPLRCIFCHNPETQDTGIEIAFSAKDCIGCGACSEVCPEGAIHLGALSHIDRQRCTRCMKCVKVCPGSGLKAIGSYYEPETLAGILLRDMPFYRHSGGGVTLSGGECAIYPDYLESLLKHLKANGIHIALETAGYFEYSQFKQKILPYLDLIYYDIKIADYDAHERFTGRSNHIIFNNLSQLIKEGTVEVVPRVPLVPGVTASSENLSAIVDILCDAGAENVTLLPYNPMGMAMYSKLGKRPPLLSESFMKPDEEREIYEMLRRIIEERRSEIPISIQA